MCVSGGGSMVAMDSWGQVVQGATEIVDHEGTSKRIRTVSSQPIIPSAPKVVSAPLYFLTSPRNLKVSLVCLNQLFTPKMTYSLDKGVHDIQIYSCFTYTRLDLKFRGEGDMRETRGIMLSSM